LPSDERWVALRRLTPYRSSNIRRMSDIRRTRSPSQWHRGTGNVPFAEWPGKGPRVDTQLGCGTDGEGGRELNPEVGRRIRDFVVEEILFEDPGHPSIDEDGPLLELLDSFGIMRLVTFLEEEMGIHVEDSDITADHFRTIADVERFVSGKAGQG
jgi:acyl carrier protein